MLCCINFIRLFEINLPRSNSVNPRNPHQCTNIINRRHVGTLPTAPKILGKGQKDAVHAPDRTRGMVSEGLTSRYRQPYVPERLCPGPRKSHTTTWYWGASISTHRGNAIITMGSDGSYRFALRGGKTRRTAGLWICGGRSPIPPGVSGPGMSGSLWKRGALSI